MATDTPERLNLQRQKQQVTVDALIAAAQRGLVERGLDVTVDDIAARAGIGRRTVFRHFASREELLHAALAAALADYEQALPQYGGGDWVAWISEFAHVSHRVFARAGRLMWELRTRRLPPRLVDDPDVLKDLFRSTAETLWRAADGDGSAPEEVRQAVAAHLSPMFAQAVLLDADGSPELAAELATNAIVATVRALLSR
jgi:AcrR family transcriptional regulator